jgi:hypothetical protein
MSHIKTCFAYIIAVLCIFVSVATFVGNRFFAGRLAETTGIKVAPIISGGEVRQTLSLKGYKVKIHEPVFQGLFSSRKQGFVQIDFVGSPLPQIITCEIDYDNDGVNDFKITCDTKTGKGTIVSYNPRVESLEGVYPVKNGFAARINLKNTRP